MPFMKLEAHHSSDLSNYHSRQLFGFCLRTSSSSPLSSASSFDFEPLQLRDISSPIISDSYWGLQRPSTVSGFGAPQNQISEARFDRDSRISSSFDSAPATCGTSLPSELDYWSSEFGKQQSSCLTAQIQERPPIESSVTPGYDFSPQCVQAGSKAYLMAIMADNNTHNYGWQSRPPHPLHPSSMSIDQQPFTQPQTLPPTTGYPVGYHAQQTTTQGFYQPGIPAPHYLCSPHPGMLQSRQPPRRHVASRNLLDCFGLTY
ncbi:hypothetical protein BBP40_011433 [Aspergillus hancockii]|nr:hypothetical protein BBP40_011433 [Aspergillus hancockii]